MRFVHQDLGLVADLSISENFGLEGGFPLRGPGRIAWRVLHRTTQDALDRAEVDLDPRLLVRELRPSDRALVAIARALRDVDAGRRLTIVLDEPTASLPRAEAELLLDAVRRCRDRGQTVVYVSHRLTEVLDIADRITVLRDGAVAADLPAAGADIDRLITAMTGEAPAPQAARPVRSTGRRLLSVRGLCAGPLRDVDLDIHAGEVVGIVGLLGSGRSSLLRALFGDTRRSAGSITLGGSPAPIVRPADAIRRGIALVPEDRARDSAFPDRPLWENTSAATVRRYWAGWRMDRPPSGASSIAVLDDFRIRAPRPTPRCAPSPGGNQQKAMLARWFRLDPQLLLLDEPTQGVDAMARADIHALVHAHVDRGNAALVVSSDLEELQALCDRVVVLRGGTVVATLAGAELTETAMSRATQVERTESDGG